MSGILRGMAPKKSAAKSTPKSEPAVRREQVPHHRITRLEVESGFLDGLALELSPGLNCLIGERGTGKTTVLEFLRWALKGESDSKRQRSLLKENLGSGVVRVGLETKEGLRLTVERQGGAAAAEVLNAEGAPAGFTLEHGVLFDCDVFSQDEIESIASTPRKQLELLDRFARAEVQELEVRLRGLVNELRGNAHELLTLEETCGALEEGTAGLAEMQEKLAALVASGAGAGLDALEREVGRKGLRDREARAVEQVQRWVDGRREGLLRERGGLGQAARLVPDDALDGPNGARMKALQAIADEARAAAERALGQALRALEAGGAALEALRAGLAKDHLAQEAGYRELVTRHEAERGRATERVELQKRLNAALDQQRVLEDHDAQLVALRRRRKELLSELQRLRQERYAVRCREAERLTRELGPRISVVVMEAGDQTAYEALLGEALAGLQKQVQPLAKAISERVPSRDLVRIVQNRQADALAQHAKLAPKKAEQVVEHLLRAGELLFEVEVVETDDLPRITLLDEEKAKELSTLSTGQKCTTVLPILLLEETKPLLIDQPEDNLDNRYVFEVVVGKLRAIKLRRQLIFVTHNANIPVLGDAERVIVMKSSGDRARVLRAGTVDEVKDHVETILEGGPEAFEARRKRYGH